jgi:hypothetical protein
MNIALHLANAIIGVRRYRKGKATVPRDRQGGVLGACGGVTEPVSAPFPLYVKPSKQLISEKGKSMRKVIKVGVAVAIAATMGLMAGVGTASAATAGIQGSRHKRVPPAYQSHRPTSFSRR